MISDRISVSRIIKFKNLSRNISIVLACLLLALFLHEMWLSFDFISCSSLTLVAMNSSSEIRVFSFVVIAMIDLRAHFQNPPEDWKGDPCLPSRYSWTGVTCSEGPRIRIVSL